jgi:hypothetical protein
MIFLVTLIQKSLFLVKKRLHKHTHEKEIFKLKELPVLNTV